MCELFGFSGQEPVELTPWLRPFFQHSVRHPHGWGLALERGGSVQVHKEPVRAVDSGYLKKALETPVAATLALGHIRYATIGHTAWNNCHPYCARDLSGRSWTLIHNGTIFHFAPMDPFYAMTDSDTDSACLLSYILSQMNAQYRAQGAPLSRQQRFEILDRIVTELSPGNKVNLMIYDGELLYVHTNYRASLFRRQLDQGVLFSTHALDEDGWEPVPFTQLLAYQDGVLQFSGTCHGAEYQEDPEQLRLLYLSCAAL